MKLAKKQKTNIFIFISVGWQVVFPWSIKFILYRQRLESCGVASQLLLGLSIFSANHGMNRPDKNCSNLTVKKYKVTWWTSSLRGSRNRDSTTFDDYIDLVVVGSQKISEIFQGLPQCSLPAHTHSIRNNSVAFTKSSSESISGNIITPKQLTKYVRILRTRLTDNTLTSADIFGKSITGKIFDVLSNTRQFHEEMFGQGVFRKLSIDRWEFSSSNSRTLRFFRNTFCILTSQFSKV